MTPAIDLHEQARCRQSVYRTGIKLRQWELITAALKECKGNHSLAARELGIHRNTLVRIAAELRAVGLVVPSGRPDGRQEPRKYDRRHTRFQEAG